MIKFSRIKNILSSSCLLDNYLVDISKKISSHASLGGATLGCYIRLIKVLVALYCTSTDLSKVKVLDWGSGKGHISYLLKNAGFDVTSCDIASDTGDSTFSQNTPILHENNIYVVPLSHEWRLPFDDHSFDLVVSFGVLEHVSNDVNSMREIRRVLTRGGIFFFCFLPYFLSWTQRFAHLRGNFYHSRLYSVNQIRSLARSAGFEVYKVWHGQFLPKNSLPNSNLLELLDRVITFYTPLRYLSTNLEGILIAD